MKIVLSFLYLLIVVYAYPPNSPVDTHGRLKVQGIQLVSSIGQPVQLKGLSTHGPQWFPNCYTFASFQAQVQDWNANVIRIAMYVNEYGYNTNPTYWKARVQEMIDWAGDLGVYVVVDWHVLNPGDPTDSSYSGAQDFWTTIATNNLGKDHILYEIANEPNGVNWSALSIYHTNMINLIRNIDSNSVIILGTPWWSSDLFSISALNFPNLLYTLHFYAGSGTVNDDYRNAASNYPIFVTEYGTCTYTGSGTLNLTSADEYVDFMNGNNFGSQIISFINWSFSDANESCAALQPDSCNNRQWNNVTTSGAWVKSKLM